MTDDPIEAALARHVGPVAAADFTAKVDWMAASAIIAQAESVKPSPAAHTAEMPSASTHAGRPDVRPTIHPSTGANVTGGMRFASTTAVSHQGTSCAEPENSSKTEIAASTMYVRQMPAMRATVAGGRLDRRGNTTPCGTAGTSGQARRSRPTSEQTRAYGLVIDDT